MQLVITGNDKKIVALEKELRFRAKIFGFTMELINDSEPEEELDDEAETTDDDADNTDGNSDEEDLTDESTTDEPEEELEEEVEAKEEPVKPKSAAEHPSVFPVSATSASNWSMY